MYGGTGHSRAIYHLKRVTFSSRSKGDAASIREPDLVNVIKKMTEAE